MSRLTAGASETHNLIANRRQKLTIAASARSAGYVLFLGRHPGDDPAASDVPARTEIGADSRTVIGPFSENANFRVVCDLGELVASVS